MGTNGEDFEALWRAVDERWEERLESVAAEREARAQFLSVFRQKAADTIMPVLRDAERRCQSKHYEAEAENDATKREEVSFVVSRRGHVIASAGPMFGPPTQVTHKRIESALRFKANPDNKTINVEISGEDIEPILTEEDRPEDIDKEKVEELIALLINPSVANSESIRVDFRRPSGADRGNATARL